jgi:hypothetical protein
VLTDGDSVVLRAHRPEDLAADDPRTPYQPWPWPVDTGSVGIDETRR